MRKPALTAEERSFNRKIRWSRRAIYIERLWPRLWALISVAGLFVLASFFGLWPMLDQLTHIGVLTAFGVAGASALLFALLTKWPSHDEAVHRLEQLAGVRHRPASTYSDTLSSAPPDGTTAAIWNAHRERLKEDLNKLQVTPPVPRTDKHDKFALRVVFTMALIAGFVFVGDAAKDRLWAAFHAGTIDQIRGLRLDAWVTPPPYTRRPPILVADGAVAAQSLEAKSAAPVEVPENSAIVVRMGGKPEVALALEYLDAQGKTMGEPVGEEDEAGQATVNQVKGVIGLGVSGVRVTANGAPLASWSFSVVADQAPTVKFTKDIEKSRRGSMKLFYAITDDYGIATAEAKIERLPLEPGDPKTSWARREELKGPRPPLTRPPRISLRVPPPNAKKPETWSFHDIGSHPWAGMPVRLTLIVRDHAGHTGRSKSLDMVLPERAFFNPLARAVLEQRRRLVFDPRYRDLVIQALDALTLEPDGFINDKAVYLGLRSVRHRLRNDRSRRTINSAIDQMWHLALRIENGGGLSEAERRLREIHERLSKAIERGASQKEIAELMRQLRQALAQFLNELAKQAQKAPQQQQSQNQQNQTMSSQDLQRMLDNLERMMRQGSKQSAQEMLSQLRDLLDRLQSGRMVRRPGQGQQGQSQQMMQMMDQFGKLIGRQQQLMDDTFGAQRQPGQQGQGQRRQGQQQGQGRGQRRGQQQGQGRGQRQGQQFGQGRGQRQGQQGQGRGQQRQGQNGQGGREFSPRGLGQRQGQLGEMLDQLRQGLNKFGMQPPGELGGAQESMRNAERALREGQLDRALEEQARALDQLRSGTKNMAEQMMRQMRSRVGQGRGSDAPLDPLGRPQRTEGPDLGTSVKVPDRIDAQRAREILELLRKRLGERFRPEIELEYIERLLKRF
ncbi:MAG: TIGR02302 family protein [Pseudomonadota bacterium]